MCALVGMDDGFRSQRDTVRVNKLGYRIKDKIHSKGITQNPGKDLFGISIYYCGEIDSRRLTVDDISNVC